MSTRGHPAFYLPRFRARAQLLFLPDGRVLARAGDRDVALHGVSARFVREVTALCDGVHSAAAIQAALADAHGRQATAALLASLSRAGVLENAAAQRPADPATRQPVVLIGNGPLLGALRDAFAAAGFAATRTIRATGWRRQSPNAQGAVVSAPPAPLPVLAGAEDSDSEDAAGIGLLLAGAAFAVCALEGTPWQAIFEVNRAALCGDTPCLFITAGTHRAVLGPTVLSGPGPCVHCRVLVHEPLAEASPEVFSQSLSPAADGADLHFVQQVAAGAVAEARAALTAGALRLNSVLVLEPEPRVSRESLLATGACPACGARPAARHGPALVSAVAEIDRAWLPSPTLAAAAQPMPGEDVYRRVAILGGGTAGYLSALALRAAYPWLDITVVESSRIPVIGVGEATTPEMVRMLHSPRFLGLDVVDFHRRVQPTFKLGIRFGWGTPQAHDFPFPFQRGRLAEAARYAGTLDAQSLGALLMARHALPLFRAGPGAPVESLLHRLRWAYHLDNRRFVAYLQQEAKAAGIGHMDAVVDGIECASDGETVERVRTVDGRTLEADLWLDCSGFRSLLMGGELRSPFIDYSDTLFTDRAIAANVPHGGRIKPYTHARTMDAGWCWSIPFADADHCGYVFSSAFLDDERALDEMRKTNPGLSDPWTVGFRSGRRRHFWKGNVVALGNAYAFVEPLQSTALHMLVYELELLTTHFPVTRSERSFQAALNRRIGERWDALRWFLGVHYRFNTCRDTPFWQAANHDADISGAEQRVALYRERAPLSYRPSHHYRWLPPEFFSDDHAYDSMLTGLGIGTRRLDTAESRAGWERSHAVLAAGAGIALEQAEGLEWLLGDGAHTLSRLGTRADSWIQLWHPA